MTRYESDAGPGALSGFATLFFLVFVGCLAFLTTDVRHRAEGYQAVMSAKGVPGVVTVTGCRQSAFGDFCTGRFVSQDGRVTKDRTRVNGADNAPVTRAAVLSPKGDVWTASGRPWLRPSPVFLATAAPVALGFMIVYGLLTGRAAGLRNILDGRRSAARERSVRLGRVH